MVRLNRISEMFIVCQPPFKKRKFDVRGFSLKATDYSFTKG